MPIFIVFVIILALLLIIFALQNAMDISITVFFWEIVNAPLIVVLLSSIFLGFLIASFYFYPKLWKLKRQHKQMIRFNKELKELHEMNLKKEETVKKETTDPEGIELETENDENSFFSD